MIEMNERQEKLFETLIFFAKMLLAGGVFWTVLYVYPDTTGIQAWFGGFIGLLLNISGIEAFTQGTGIFIDDIQYVITQDCLGWKSMAAFTALVFASSGLRDNLKPLVSGIVLIAVANTVRVYSTVLLSHHGIISFEVIHGFLWKWGLTFVVLAAWGLWYVDLEKVYQKWNSQD